MNELIFLVNFRAKGRVVDKRGQWAEELSSYLGVDHWGISADGVMVRDLPNDGEHTLQAVVASRQIGLSMRNIKDVEDFAKTSHKFFDWIAKQPELGHAFNTQRVGVRGRFLTRFDGKFSELIRRISTRYVTIAPRAVQAIGEAELRDTCGVLNFKDGLGDFNTQCGPMEEEQAKQFFSFAKPDSIPKVSIYFDNDYFRTPSRDVKAAWLEQFIQEGALQGWKRHQRVREMLIVGDDNLGQQKQATEPTIKPHIDTRQGSLFRGSTPSQTN